MRSKIAKVGIIGGSGVEELGFTAEFKDKKVKTRYGEVLVKTGLVKEKEVVFLNRHGWAYTAPGQINYLANLAALKEEGVGCIFATAAVGALHKKLAPGDLLLFDDLIDMTRKRVGSYDARAFIDMSTPYTPFLTEVVKKAAAGIKLKLEPNIIYVCTEGPRFETRAEIRLYKKFGGDVVGMTQVPEVILAAEISIPYAAIGVVTNYAAGVTSRRISAHEVLVVMKQRSAELARLLEAAIRAV
ncbi:MAG: MTAP family purine nucleoside phosphorylase [Candidatus Saganbacteria bacterium]|nr:MTAP family purine nucleoside phosphorylase [Candidatus Saganbacteria bacterium]